MEFQLFQGKTHAKTFKKKKPKAHTYTLSYKFTTYFQALIFLW